MITFDDLTKGLPPFKEFSSITRLRRNCIVTEKIDGTNASVTVLEDGRVVAGSRSRYVFDPKEHFNFPKWVNDNAEELRGLGIGTHYGEWWGQGIQRKYGLDHKRFSLFNVGKWRYERPACCHVVPVLYEGIFDTEIILDLTVKDLQTIGSMAAPGFMKPEGIVVFHEPSQSLFKYTLDKNDGHKSENK